MNGGNNSLKENSGIHFFYDDVPSMPDTYSNVVSLEIFSTKLYLSLPHSFRWKTRSIARHCGILSSCSSPSLSAFTAHLHSTDSWNPSISRCDNNCKTSSSKLARVVRAPRCATSGRWWNLEVLNGLEALFEMFLIIAMYNGREIDRQGIIGISLKTDDSWIISVSFEMFFF